MQLYFGLYAAMGNLFHNCIVYQVTDARLESQKRKISHRNCTEIVLKNSVWRSNFVFKGQQIQTIFRKFFPNSFRDVSHRKVFSINCLELCWNIRKIVKSPKRGLTSRKRMLKSQKWDWSLGNQDLSHGIIFQEIVSKLFEIVWNCFKIVSKLF